MAFSMFNRNISMKVQVWMKTMDKKTLWSLYPSANSLTQRRSTENYIPELNKLILFNKKKGNKTLKEEMCSQNVLFLHVFDTYFL